MYSRGPETLAVAPDCPDRDVVAAVAGALRAGELVLLPTDTVYGIACRADRECAVERLFAAKGRDRGNPLPILVSGLDGAARVCSHMSEDLRRLADAFWPGPLTIVVPRAATVSALVTAGRESVGVRAPALGASLAVLAACEFPVAVSSANRSGDRPATSVSASREVLAGVAIALDAGPAPGGVASTVIDISTDIPSVLRNGPVSAEQLSAVLGRPVLQT